MTLEQFQNHGWKATDKVVYKGEILNVSSVALEAHCVIAHYENSLKGCVLLTSEMFELHQPELVHENK